MFKKLKQKHHDIGYEEGLIFAAEYYEPQILELKNKIEELESLNRPVTKSKEQEDHEDNRMLVHTFDDIMLWADIVSEIVHTQYFNGILFNSTETDHLKGLIELIDYAMHSSEVKIQYPNTYLKLPGLIKSMEKVYQNRLLIDEAEGY